MFEILYTGRYNNKARKFFKHHPELLKQYEKTLKLLEVNPFHPSLRLHKLKGKLSELFSGSINISYRISIDFYIQEEKIVPIDIGSHDNIY